jgi:hypothetical protein
MPSTLLLACGVNLMTGKWVNKNGKAWGDGLTENAVWHVVREYARKAAIEKWLRTTSGGLALGCVMRRAENWNKSIPPRARLDPNDRAISRLQTAYPVRGERPDWHRTGVIVRRHPGQFADDLDRILAMHAFPFFPTADDRAHRDEMLMMASVLRTDS